MNLQATFAATLVDEWLRAGINDVVLAPGSRSTPMALAVAEAEAQRRLRVHVHLDERAAAFFALGVGLASGRPAVVITTSGTAAAELQPAAVEAHHARVPLILCTADRPAELHDIGAPQTIDQRGLFGGGLRWRCDPGLPPPATWRSVGARVVAEAVAGPNGPGPVHLNLAFSDPLIGDAGPLPPGRPDGAPWHRVVGGRPSVDGATVAELAATIDGRRGVIVAGAGISEPASVLALAEGLGWPVLADPRSRCRGDGVVRAFDALLRAPAFAASIQPEMVLRIGTPLASKVLSAWLAATGATQVLVDPYGAWPDPERAARVVVRASAASVCCALVEARPRPAPSAWLEQWAKAEGAAQAAIDAVLGRHPEITEPGVARSVTGALGADVTLVVGSSMPIRDVEWFGHPDTAARVLANRGANGIDGVVSTALGVAAAGAVTVALIGDLTFLHDIGALLWSTRRGVQLTLVVVDNDGGGIFSFLPQAGALEARRFEQLFATPHGTDLATVAAVHGIEVTRAATAADVVPAVRDAIGRGGVRLVLAASDRHHNVAVHDEITRAVTNVTAG